MLEVSSTPLEQHPWRVGIGWGRFFGGSETFTILRNPAGRPTFTIVPASRQILPRRALRARSPAAAGAARPMVEDIRLYQYHTVTQAQAHAQVTARH